MQTSGHLPYLDPFQAGAPRPYLWLHVTAPNGSNGNIVGLVDTGADITQLPEGYAALMGYTAAALEPITITTASNTVTLRRAITPCTATVVGIPEVPISFKPVFSPGSALWGRGDFMAAFNVLIEERQQRFTLLWE